MSSYTYGDSALASERLALLAATFEPMSRLFIERSTGRHPKLAVDLGCGPGHTTAMLHQATGATSTVGLDASASYIEQASASAMSGVTFTVHDVTTVPFPTAPADVLYARLLLAHLPDPAGRVHDWATQLGTGGVALLDDLESIETEDAGFRAYLDEVALDVVRRRGGALFVGPALHTMSDPPGTDRIHDEVAVLRPAPAVTARIFAMNLRVLVDTGESEPRPDLAAHLAAVAEGRRQAAPVEWPFRQVALRKAPTG